jgi:SIR2-like domain
MTVVEGELSDSALPQSTVVKLHGSWARPKSLIITEQGVVTLDRAHPRLWNALLEVLRRRVVVTVGMSMRDPSIIRLFTEAASTVRGYAVLPGSFRLRNARLDMLNPQAVDANAEKFFEEFERRAGP